MIRCSIHLIEGGKCVISFFVSRQSRIVQSQTQQTLEKADQKQVYALLRQKSVVPTSFRVVVWGNLGT